MRTCDVKGCHAAAIDQTQVTIDYDFCQKHYDDLNDMINSFLRNGLIVK